MNKIIHTADAGATMDKAKAMQKALDSVPPQKLGDRVKLWNGFLYGEWSVGKTIVTSRLVKRKGLFVVTDAGSNSLYNHPELLDKIEVVPYSGLSQLTAIGTAVTESYGGYDEFDLICVDTISQVQEEYLDWLNDNYTFGGNMREKATPRPGSGLSRAEEIIGLGDYNLARRNMSTPIKTLVKAPVNVMFLAHLREPTFMEQSKGKLVRRPTLTETVFKLIARESTFMGLMEREGKKRTIQFKTDKKTVSKSQIAELDDEIVTDDEFVQTLTDWEQK
jgi:hypothetical protein